MTTMEQSRAWTGPAVLSYGFRPFFLAAAVWAAAMVGLWLPWILGVIVLPSALRPVDWHAHELLFGYVAAVMAGFMLTAIPNWTGRLPVVGLPLAGLFALWLAGRVAVALSAWTGAAPALALALLFPVCLWLMALREIVAAGAGRNLVVLVLFGLFAGGQAVFLVETVWLGGALYGPRIAVAVALMLVLLIGGRIIPSFTTNWLRRAGAARLPAPFGRADAGALLVGAAGLATWIALPALDGARWPGIPLAAAGLAHLARQLRWRPLPALREPLLGVLHLAYAFAPLGFLLAGAGLLLDAPSWASGATHVWTIGTIGLMTLAVMTRATRGHTGRPLTAPPATVALYAGLVLAAFARLGAAVHPAAAAVLLPIAAAAWVWSFAGFAVLYGGMLLAPASRR